VTECPHTNERQSLKSMRIQKDLVRLHEVTWCGLQPGMQAPKSMRSFTAALNLFATSLGSWMCIPIIYLVNIDKTNQVRSIILSHSGAGDSKCGFSVVLSIQVWIHQSRTRHSVMCYCPVAACGRDTMVHDVLLPPTYGYPADGG
jgi:hypothetical protein